MKPVKHLAALVVIVIPVFVYVFIRATAAPAQPKKTPPAPQAVVQQNVQQLNPTVAPAAPVQPSSPQVDLIVVGTNFMTALKNKDYQTAHNLLDPSIAAVFTPATLPIIVGGLAPGYADITSWQFANISGGTSGPTSALKGTVKLANGTQQPLVLTLKKEGTQWMVSSISNR